MMEFYYSPFYLRRSDYCGMPPMGRLVLHGLAELLEDEPVLYVNYRMLACWLSLSLPKLRQGIKAIMESGILEIQERGPELRICYFGHDERAAQE